MLQKQISNCKNILCIYGYIEDKGMDKYLIFDSKDKNKELLKKYNVFNSIRKKSKK